LESLNFCLRQLLAPDNATNGKSRFVVLHVEIDADDRVGGVNITHRTSEAHGLGMGGRWIAGRLPS
jgi:hypothetical protein